QSPAPSGGRTVAWRDLRHGAGHADRSHARAGDGRTGQPLCGHRAATDRVPGLGGVLVCRRVDAERLELAHPRDLDRSGTDIDESYIGRANQLPGQTTFVASRVR